MDGPLRLRLNALSFDLHIDHKLGILYSKKTVEAKNPWKIQIYEYLCVYALNDFLFNTALKFFNKIYA